MTNSTRSARDLPRSTSDEVNRLWRALKRDLSASILLMAGGTDDDRAIKRFEKNWDKLCERDLDVAARIHHAINEIQMMTGRYDDPNGPAARQEQRLDEMIGMAQIGRDKHPAAKASTLGELIELAEQSIKDEIDDETGGSDEH